MMEMHKEYAKKIDDIVDTDVRSKDLSPTEKLELKIAIYKEEDRLIAVNGYKVSKMSY